MELRLELKNNQALEVAKRNFPKVVARSLRKIMDQSRTHLSRSVRERYNIKASDIKPLLRTSVNDADLVGRIKISGRKIPIMDFGARQTKAGAAFSIVRGSRKFLSGSFIVAMKSGHRGVFMRKGSERLPIMEKFTISLPQMVGSRRVVDKLNEFIREKFPAICRQELKYFVWRNL